MERGVGDLLRREANHLPIDFDWLKKKLSELKKFTEDLCKVSNVHYEAHSWTPLKLVALTYWVDVYTKIIPNYFENYWYLDLLSGSGTNLVKETGDVVIGSPFIAYLFARRPFSRYVFAEFNADRFKALKSRVEALGVHSKASIFNEDCNTVVKGLDLACDHMLVFADCEGLDVYWSTVVKLLEKPSDVIVLFQTKELNRTLGRARRGLPDERKLNLFMGDNSWKQAGNADELLVLYMEKLLQYRNYVQDIKIRGRFEYDLILACKPGPYTTAWEFLKRKLEAVTDRDAELALKKLKGEVKALNDFFKQSTPTLNRWLEP